MKFSGFSGDKAPKSAFWPCTISIFRAKPDAIGPNEIAVSVRIASRLP